MNIVEGDPAYRGFTPSKEEPVLRSALGQTQAAAEAARGGRLDPLQG